MSKYLSKNGGKEKGGKNGEKEKKLPKWKRGEKIKSLTSSPLVSPHSGKGSEEVFGFEEKGRRPGPKAHVHPLHWLPHLFDRN
jgi:hypothetical protein